MSELQQLTRPVLRNISYAILIIVTMSGNLTALFYAAVIFCLYPIIIGMIVDGWEQNGLLIRESESITVQHRLYGVRFKEEITMLRNVYFSDIKQLESKLTMMAIVKVFLILTNVALALYFLLQSLIHPIHDFYDISKLTISFLMLAFIIIKSRKYKLLFLITKNKNWILKRYIDNNNEYHSAYFLVKSNNEEYHIPVFAMCLK